MRTDMIHSRQFWLRDLLLIFFGLWIFFMIGLAVRPYLTPSEARYIEIPRQMLANDDWLTPRINGVPYFEKPPLFYWMQAVSMFVLDSTGEFAGRLATTKLMAFMGALTYIVGRLLYGRRTGLLSALVFGTSLLTYALSRISMLDVPVSAFLTLTFTCFLLAQKTKYKSFYYLMYIASALAVMSKGLIGIVIPGMVIAVWIFFTGQWKILREVKLFRGLLVFLAITAPWHIMMSKAHPEFAHFYFINEHFERFLTTEHKRIAPWWFFITIVIAGFVPWTGLLPAALKRQPRKTPFDLLMKLWVFLPLIFFSLSNSKLVPYIFPIFPPLAVMIGRTLSQVIDRKLPLQTLRHAGLFLILVLCSLLVAIHYIPALHGKSAEITQIVEKISRISLIPLCASLLILCITLLNSKRSAQAIIAAMALCGATLGMSVNYITGPLDRNSVKRLALEIKPLLHENDMVVAYGNYWQDLPVYLDRNVTVVEWRGELNFGYEHYPTTHAWMISTQQFWEECAASKRDVYVFILKKTYETMEPLKGCNLEPYAEYGNTVLLRDEKPPRE